MKTKPKNIFERYGLWVAYGRFPQLRYVRRLAASNPEDFGRYAIYLMVLQTISAITKAINERVPPKRQKVSSTPSTFYRLYGEPKPTNVPLPNLPVEGRVQGFSEILGHGFVTVPNGLVKRDHKFTREMLSPDLATLRPLQRVMVTFDGDNVVWVAPIDY